MIIEVGAYALLAAWLLLWAARRVELSEAARGAWPAWIALGGWLLLQAIYVVPMPRAVVEMLSPEAARVAGARGGRGHRAQPVDALDRSPRFARVPDEDRGLCLALLPRPEPRQSAFPAVDPRERARVRRGSRSRCLP
jgi:hypothetical protein